MSNHDNANKNKSDLAYTFPGHADA